MPDFTYNTPDEAAYMNAIILMLKQRGHFSLATRLINARCSIQASDTFSQVRWNGKYTTIIFYLPIDEFTNFHFQSGFEDEKQVLIHICTQLMPAEVGYDVREVDVAPSLQEISRDKSIEDEILEIHSKINQSPSDLSLPSDILDYGKMMATVYFYLYGVENYLRLFIQRVGTMVHGEEYFRNITIPSRIRATISSRKEQEDKNQWISVRGNSELFYLDFKELGDIITNNWGMFQRYFPSQHWILAKIDELGNCRNLVAHNSLVSEHEIDVIRTNFKSIVRQLSQVMN